MIGRDEYKAKRCEVCGEVHRADYRSWSEYFKQWLSPTEFLTALDSQPKAA
jgi:hypothetical protein